MDAALYHPWLKEKGGAEKVVLEIAKRSEHDFTVYTLFYDLENTFTEFEDLEVEELTKIKPRGFILKGIIFGLGSLLFKIPDRHDTLLISEAGLGSLMAFRNNHRTLCYCHTPLRMFLPEFSETYKKEMNPVIRPLYSTMKKVYDFLERKAWKRFEHVFANSETTKERIIAKRLKHSDDITVLNPGVDIDNPERDFENYFLYPSRFRRYKRQDLAVKAFKEANLDDFKLVLAGSSQEEDYLEELRDISRDEEDIEIKTDLPGEEWQELYRNCYAVLFLAEKEDWGIIPVEAGSYGKPVIAVDEGGPQESVIDGETGFLVEPDAGDIADKMEELAEDENRAMEMGKRGKEESERYSWTNFVEKIDQKLREKS